MKADNAAATRPKTFISACRKITILTQLDTGIQWLEPGRIPQYITGVMKQVFSKKRLTKKSIPLSQKAIEALENCVADNADDKEIVIAGFLRFMIGARMRAKDAAEIRQEPTLDLNEDTGVGYIDVVADKSKTAQGFRGREGTEITAHSWGLVHDTWALDWLKARARLGLHAEADDALHRGRSTVLHNQGSQLTRDWHPPTGNLGNMGNRR